MKIKTNRILLIVATCVIVAVGAYAAVQVSAVNKNGSVPVQAGLNYQLWQDVLSTFVDDNGLVDYEGLKAQRTKFDTFVNQVQLMDISKLSSSNEIKAFWINAYNAITLNVILEKYPVKSIRNINFGLVWEIDRKVAGGKKGLGEIEHKILRPLGDPRIHFAINCASIGCPKLRNSIFDPKKLDEQLDYEARRFINDPEKVWLERQTNTLFYSAIFDWFEDDFLVVEKDLLSYIKRYINDDDRQYLDNHDVNLKVLDYDWGLNTQR